MLKLLITLPVLTLLLSLPCNNLLFFPPKVNPPKGGVIAGGGGVIAGGLGFAGNKFFIPFPASPGKGIIGILGSIITMYISFYLLLTTNNNNMEFQFRDTLFEGGKLAVRIGLGVDGISTSLILVTTILMPILIFLSQENPPKVNLFPASPGKGGVILGFGGNKYCNNLLLIESLLLVLFSSVDLFLFFTLFELLLIPMFFLIYNNNLFPAKPRSPGKLAAYRFIIYSIVGSLIMVIGSLLILYIKYGSTNNDILFIKLLFYGGGSVGLSIIWLSFFISFAIKVPIFPFHTWLPFVHVEAPTIGSMLLAGIMLKLGTYGIIRYSVSILGGWQGYYMPLIITVAVLSIIYGSITTLRQIDLKKIIAYSSIVHMNFAILGLFSNELEGLLGGCYLMVSHAFVSSGLFLLIGILYKRYHTRVLFYFNGLVLTMPLFSVMFFLFTLANVSAPLMGSFIPEILIIFSTVKINFYIGLLISSSLILSTSYALWLTNRLLFGQLSAYINLYADLSKKEFISLLPLLLLTLFLGLSPHATVDLYTLSVVNLLYP